MKKIHKIFRIFLLFAISIVFLAGCDSMRPEYMRTYIKLEYANADYQDDETFENKVVDLLIQLAKEQKFKYRGKNRYYEEFDYEQHSFSRWRSSSNFTLYFNQVTKEIEIISYSYDTLNPLLDGIKQKLDANKIRYTIKNEEWLGPMFKLG